MTVQTSRPVMEHLARWLRALFGLKPVDEPVLVQSAPLFALVTATMVAVGTFTRAIFLTDHEIRMLPWVFLASAVFTSIASIAYISAMGRTSLTNRAPSVPTRRHSQAANSRRRTISESAPRAL